MPLKLHIPQRGTFAVADLAEASAKYSDIRDASGEGASTFSFGKIYDGRKCVGHVSYNGRIWRDDPCARNLDWRNPAQPIYDNRSAA
jgi:hypothetical protein